MHTSEPIMLTTALALLVATARADIAPEDTNTSGTDSGADTAAKADDSGCATTGTQAAAPLALALGAAALLARKRAR